MEPQEDYHPKNILITGNAGFIASHVTNALGGKYPDSYIVGIDRLDYCSRPKNWERKPYYEKMLDDNVLPENKFVFVRGNVGDGSLVSRVLEKYDIDCVLHFSAQTHVCNSFLNSGDFIQDNILVTNNLLLSCCNWGKITRFIHVSTDEVQADDTMINETGTRETDALYVSNPYAATKAGAEFIAQAFMRSFHIPIIITRGANVIGWGQYPEKLVGKFSVLLGKGKKIPIHGDGRARRNFINIGDTVAAFLIILEKGGRNNIYNIGTQNEYTVLEMAKFIIEEVTGTQDYSSHLEFVPDRLFNDKRYKLNCDKLRALGWEEKIPFREGLREIVLWYLRHLDDYNF